MGVECFMTIKDVRDFGNGGGLAVELDQEYRVGKSQWGASAPTEADSDTRRPYFTG